MGRKGTRMDMNGQRYGMLTVIGHAPDGLKSGRLKGRYRLRCDCGNEVERFGVDVRNGHVKSCGCAKLAILRQSHVTHGASSMGERTLTYKTWTAMHARCRDKNHVGYAEYGGRGIRVCERWHGPDGYANFLADVGERPSVAHSIDRLNVGGDYEPGNVRWATVEEQAINKRTTRWIEACGQRLTLQQWADRIGISAGTLHYRLASGWPESLAVTAPPGSRYRTAAARNDVNG